VEHGGEVVKKAIAVIVMVVLSVVAACAPAAPAPTPTAEPTPTPVEVLATKPEHLAGIWLNPHARPVEPREYYFRWETDGTFKYAHTLERLESRTPHERFWFEEGVYYEESSYCDPIGSYRVWLEIEEGRAVGLRFEEIDDSDPSCSDRRRERSIRVVRVD
jgi:hypothetical protein